MKNFEDLTMKELKDYCSKQTKGCAYCIYKNFCMYSSKHTCEKIDDYIEEEKIRKILRPDLSSTREQLNEALDKLEDDIIFSTRYDIKENKYYISGIKIWKDDRWVFID